MSDRTTSDGPAFRYARIEKQLMEMIESGQLQPGDRLPSLRKISKRLHVSVPTVAQAYAALEQQGVLEARERSGFFIREDFNALPVPSLCPNARPEEIDLSRPGVLKAIVDIGQRKDGAPFVYPCPDKSLLAARCLSKVLRATVQEYPQESVLLDDPLGNQELRRQIAVRCMEIGTVVSPDEIMITSGAMDSISLLLRVLTRPGDAILVQSPTFMVYLQMVELMGLRAIEIPSCSQDGVSLDLVAKAIDDYNIRACLFITNYHVDGSLMSDEKKRELVELLRKRRIPLIEDDVYGNLFFGERRPTKCKNFDTEGLVATCSSISKTVSPGYRIGWVIPGKFMEQVRQVRDMAGIVPSTPAQMALGEFMRKGEFERHLKPLRQRLSRAMSALYCSIGHHFPEGTCASRPSGSMNMWVRLPRQVDSSELFFKARKQGILVVPGSILSFSDTFKNYIRLNSKGIWDEQSEDAVALLGELVRDMARQ